MSLVRADRLSPAELLDVWNRGFSGYYVDNTMDEKRLAAHLRWSGVDLSKSAVLLVEEKPAAFSLAAVERRGGRHAAWIAGFGVAPEHRRKGLAGALMRGHCEMLDAAGIVETTLEVIDENPARRVYAAVGFQELRTLISYQGAARPEDGAPAALERLEMRALEELHARLHKQVPPVWRRELVVLNRIVEDSPAAELLAVPNRDSYGAYALAIAGPERVSLLDACAAEAESARRLVGGLAAAFGGKPMRIIDEPAGSAMGLALREAGLGALLTQLEMARKASAVSGR